MNIDNLNTAIEYIEENLTNKIDYKELSKIVGISEQSFNRIFTFLTDISLTEYIRKRRLSKAYEELKNSNIKIIDLAIKYQYESDISFTRAFKKMFGITPSECRKKDNNFVLFPIARFSDNNKIKELKYEILEIKEEKEIYCLYVEDKNYEEFLYKIKEMYDRVSKLDLYKDMNKVGMYGVSIVENEKYKYFLGSNRNFDKSIKVIIPKGKYIVFNVGSREQRDIVEMFKSIYSVWIPSTSYNVNMNFAFELYKEDNCFLYLTLE